MEVMDARNGCAAAASDTRESISGTIPFAVDRPPPHRSAPKRKPRASVVHNAR